MESVERESKAKHGWKIEDKRNSHKRRIHKQDETARVTEDRVLFEMREKKLLENLNEFLDYVVKASRAVQFSIQSILVIELLKSLWEVWRLKTKGVYRHIKLRFTWDENILVVLRMSWKKNFYISCKKKKRKFRIANVFCYLIVDDCVILKCKKLKSSEFQVANYLFNRMNDFPKHADGGRRSEASEFTIFLLQWSLFWINGISEGIGDVGIRFICMVQILGLKV